MTIGERIAALRRAAGLSQEQMAEMLEVSRQAVSKWETGQTLPEADRIPRICALFSVSADELLGMQAPKPVQETKAEEKNKDVDTLLRASLYRRMFTVGWITALTALIELALGYFLTWSVYHRAVERAWEYGLGYRSDVMFYAKTMPMLAVFVIGGVLLVIGLVMAVLGLYMGLMHSGRGKKQENEL